MANINFKVGFNVDKAGLNVAKKELESIKDTIGKNGIRMGLDEGEIRKAKVQVESLSKAMDKAFDTDTGVLNIRKLTSELNKTGDSLESIQRTFRTMGVDSGGVFQTIQSEALKTGVEVKKAKTQIDEMIDTLGKTVKWNIASGAVNMMSNSINRAIGFTKALDESLNNIRVVTGKSAQDMKIFKDEANDAAKALGKTTTEYSDASLIFFQQGKNAADVKSLTEATLAGANVTGTEVSQMADLLTSVMNGYNIEANKAMETTDKLAAVGAATGSDFEELATGMSKVASMAQTVGVDIDSLNAQIATISTVTREAPESIGTALKTIYARMAQIKTKGEVTDEDGITYTTGNAEKALQSIGLTVLEANGQLKDMEGVLTEVGGKWDELNKVQKQAVAEALAGKQQVNKLISLFNNWDMYQSALQTSMDATGATMEQNGIRMDSLSYKTAQMRAEAEELWMKVINEDSLKGMTEMITGVLSSVNSLIDGLGGMEGVFAVLIPLATTFFSDRIAKGAQSALGSVTKLKDEIKDSFKNASTPSDGRLKASEKAARQEVSQMGEGRLKETSAEVVEKRIQLRMQEEKIAKNLSEDELKSFQNQKDKILELQEIQKKKVQEQESARKRAMQELIKEEEKSLSRQGVSEDKKAEALSKLQEQLKDSKYALDQEKDYAKEIDISSAKLEKKKTLLNDIRDMMADEESPKSLIAEFEAREQLTKREEMLKNALKDATSEGKSGAEILEEAYEGVSAQIENMNEQLENAIENQRAYSALAQEDVDISREQAEIDSLSEDMDATNKRAEKAEKWSKAISMAGMAVGGLVAVGNVMKVIGDETATAEEKAETLSSSLNGLGATLLASGNPWAMLAGGILMATTAIGKWIYLNTGMNKLMKDNEEALQNYKEKISEIKTEQQNLTTAMSKMSEAESIAEDGLLTEELETYNGLLQEAAEAAPEMVKYYDAYGNAVMKSTEEIKKYNDELAKSLDLEHQRMETQAGSFSAEMAYLLTEEEQRKNALEKQIEDKRAELDDLMTKGGSAEKVQEAQDELTVLLADMDAIKEKYAEIGSYAQEALINPFVQGQDVFKDLGKEMQGYVAGLFNADEVTANIKEIAATGNLSTEELKAKTDEYIQRYKEGVLEVANAFDAISKAAQGGNEEAIKTMDVLKTIPQDMQNVIGEAMRGMGTVLNEDEIRAKITQLMDLAGEDGKLTALEIKAFFDEQSVAIGQQLGEQLIKAGNDFMEAFSQISEDLKSSLIVGLTSEAMDETGQVINEQLMEVVNAISEGNMEMAYTLMEKNAEIRQFVVEELQAQADNEGFFDSMITTDKEEEAQAMLDKLEILNQLNEQQEVYNENLGNEGSLLDENLAKMWETKDGAEEIADVWNEMIDATSDMGEDGLFSVDIAALEEKNEALGETAEKMKENAEANEEYAESTEALKEATEDVGDAFLKMADSLGEDTFGKLIEMTGASKDELMSLAKAAQDGSTDAARKLQSEMGKIYAAMRSQDQAYYRDFVANNQARLNEVERVTGISANKYENLANYNADLERWITANGGQENFNRLMNLNQYVNEQVGMMGAAADKTVQIGEHQMSAASAAAAVAALEAAKGAVKAGAEGGKGGMAAAKQFISALATSDEAVAAALGGIQGKLKDAGDDYNAIIAIIDAEINKIKGSIKEATGTSISTDMSGWSPKPINYGGGGKVSSKPSYSGGGGGSSSGPGASSGGGGGGGKKPSKGSGGKGSGGKEEKEVEDMEWEADIYHDINAELERKSKLLDILQKQEDKLYGKELLANLQKQKQLLIDQQKLQEKKLKMQKDDAKQQADILKKQGVIINSSTGMIENYNKIIQAKVDAANKLSGEAKEKAKEEVQEFIKAMEEYETLVNDTIWETQNNIQDLIDKQREIFLQEFEYKINFQIELSEDYQDALEFQKDTNKDFEDISENLEMTTKQMLDLMDKAANIKAQIEKINADSSLTDKERIEMLEEMSKNLKDVVKDLQKMDEEITKIFKEGLKDGLDLVKEHLDAYEDMNKELKHMAQMAKLLGKEEDYEFIQSIYKQQYESYVGQIDVLNKQKDVLVAQKAALEAAGMKGSDEWKALDEAIKDTTNDLNKLTQDAIKALQNEYKAAVDEVMASLEDAMTNGAGFDKLKDQQKDIKAERKKYLDTEEKLLAISKLQSKVQKEIDETDDPAKKAKLQKFLDEEVKKLKEKDKLTKYDIDRANQLYDVTMKQMALQDQQASKSMMRLVRDAQGNWVYEFTEDLNAIAKAQNDLSSSLEKLHEMDKKNLEAVQDEMLKAQEEYYKEVQKIVKNNLEGKYASEEEFQAALEEATTKFNEKMVDLNAEYEETKMNTTISSMGVILDVYKNTGVELDGLSEQQQESLHKLAEAIGGDFQALQGFMDTLLNGDEDSIKKAFEDLGITSETEMNGIRDAMNEAIKNAQGEWNTSIGDMISKVVGDGSLSAESNKAIESIKTKWEEYQIKVNEVASSTGNDMNGMKDKINAIDKATEDLNKETDKIIKKFDDEITAIGKVTTAFEKQRGEIQKNIDKYKEYIAKIDEAIKKKKEEASGVTTKPPTKPPTNNGGNTSSGGNSSSGGNNTSKPQDPGKGSKVRVKSGRRWYYDSWGKNPSGPTDKHANKDLYIVNKNSNKYGYAVGSTSSISSGLGWLRKEDLQGFDTGGYTGEWGKDGRMALLHEKEIVLNQEDTKNILDAVKVMRSSDKSSSIANIANAILDTSIKTMNIIGSFAKSISPSNPSNISNITNDSNIEQNITIEADFSGVRSADEIERAFENMANMASQYANRNK